jgi:hypothetical protein
MQLTITKGRKEMPILIALHGADGSGKTTFAASAPNPIIIDLEGGSHELDVARAEGITSFDHLINVIRLITRDNQGFETLVIDSLSKVEPMIWSLFDDPGYGKGPELALVHWRKLTAELDRAREAGLNVVLIGHAWASPANDPTVVTPYDKMGLRLDKKAAAFIREYVYGVFYIAREVLVKKDSKNDKKGKAVDTQDKRIVYTVGRSAFDAKSRYDLPPEIELTRENGWDTIFASRVNYAKELGPMIDLIKDEGIREKAREAFTKGTAKPQVLYRRVRDLIDTQK